MSSRDLGFDHREKLVIGHELLGQIEKQGSKQAPLWKGVAFAHQEGLHGLLGPVKVKSVVNRHIWDDRYLVLTATNLIVFAAQSHYEEVVLIPPPPVFPHFSRRIG